MPALLSPAAPLRARSLRVWLAAHPDLAILAAVLSVGGFLRFAFWLRATVFIIADSENYFLPGFLLDEIVVRRFRRGPIEHAAIAFGLGRRRDLREPLEVGAGRLIEANLRPPVRDPIDRRRFTWDASDGRRAVTHVRTLQRLTGAALLEFRLETGRTHQIRMHCRMLGHPIVGDALYGGLGGPPAIRALAEGLGRHALHAAVLGFRHPISDAELDFESRLPPELRALLVALGGAEP